MKKIKISLSIFVCGIVFSSMAMTSDTQNKTMLSPREEQANRAEAVASNILDEALIELQLKEEQVDIIEKIVAELGRVRLCTDEDSIVMQCSRIIVAAQRVAQTFCNEHRFCTSWNQTVVEKMLLLPVSFRVEHSTGSIKRTERFQFTPIFLSENKMLFTMLKQNDQIPAIYRKRIIVRWPRNEMKRETRNEDVPTELAWDFEKFILDPQSPEGPKA